MSSSSVCQGLQSCLEPRVLRLKLAPPGSSFSPSSGTASARASSLSSDREKPLLIDSECGDNKKETKSNVEGHGWSFLQALTDNSHDNNKTQTDQVYVHPTVKRSSSMLSEKSLEMCTESLGSETGSNAGENNDDVSLFSFDTTRHDDNTIVLVSGNTRRVNNNNRACSFPPPLTSITDFGGVHVRPHREGGRLILEAVASPSPPPYFHAERGDGRLRLHLFEGGFDSDGDEIEEGEEEVEEGEVCDEEVSGEEEEEEEEELEERVEKVEDEMGVTKFARPSRCKESGNRDIFGDGYFELPSLSLCL